VHAFDERVHAQNVEAVPLRLDHGRIVADADRHPARRWRQAVLNAGDEFALGKVADDRWSVVGGRWPELSESLGGHLVTDHRPPTTDRWPPFAGRYFA
jgi:hypothetical protein